MREKHKLASTSFTFFFSSCMKIPHLPNCGSHTIHLLEKDLQLLFLLCACMNTCMPHECGSLKRPEYDASSSGARIIGGCKLSSVGTRNQSQSSYFVLIGGSNAVAIDCVI